jgi:hypothetical protein
MFDIVGGVEASVAGLALAAARSRPVTGAETRLLDVPAPLATLFPEGGIRKGATVAVGPMAGGYSVALSIAAGVTASGGWAVAVGLPSLGLVAAAEMGVELRRLALVPHPGEQWAVVAAALVDGFDLLMLRPPGRVRPVDARRLAARVRERGTVLLVVDAPDWPESSDLRLSLSRPRTGWEGLGAGYGCLTGRRMEVVSSGRRVGGRERRVEVWLPAPSSGRLETAMSVVPTDLPVSLRGPEVGVG